MLDSILSNVDSTTSGANIEEVLICAGFSIVLGIIAALLYMYRNTYSKGFVATIAVLPTIVQVVIMLVNGNVGAGVAVMGAFSLVRFRSAPGSAREISSIFLAMTIGLATGMGYIWLALMFTLIVGALNVILALVNFGGKRDADKKLKILIPEDLDYTGVFDDVFSEYTKSHELVKVKTTNMGSLFELHYNIVLKDVAREKGLIDEIRTRNGNLSIVCCKMSYSREEL